MSDLERVLDGSLSRWCEALSADINWATLVRSGFEQRAARQGEHKSEEDPEQCSRAQPGLRAVCSDP